MMKVTKGKHFLSINFKLFFLSQIPILNCGSAVCDQCTATSKYFNTLLIWFIYTVVITLSILSPSINVNNIILFVYYRFLVFVPNATIVVNYDYTLSCCIRSALNQSLLLFVSIFNLKIHFSSRQYMVHN